MDARKNETPECFTTEINIVKSEISSMYKSFENKLKSLEKRMSGLGTQINELKTDIVAVDSRVVILENKQSCLSNSLRRARGYNADNVPFLNKNENQEELPPILSVQDIDRLTKQQCQKYLRGYNILFHLNETTRLKEKLRDAIGLLINCDINYLFSTFTNN